MPLDLFREELLNRKLLAKYLDGQKTESIPERESKKAALREWLTALSNSSISKETSIEQRFNQLIFGDILGYIFHPSAYATAWPKPPSGLTGIRGEPDLVLGKFADGSGRLIRVVVELKPPGTDLDAPQPRRIPKTPVEQAFDCALDILGVRWVIVSDMRILRLYSVEDAHAYEEFDLQECIARDGTLNHGPFKRLYFLLHKDYLIGEGEDSATSRLLRRSAERQLSVGEAFYEIYYKIRSDLISAIERASKGLSEPHSRTEILEAAQRLLDRIIFFCFCEDAPDPLITPNTLEKVTTSARNVPGYSVYSALKSVFKEIDTGSPPDRAIQLYGYNGELFKPHALLDAIDLPNELHDKPYQAVGPDGTVTIKGVWGLYAFDFWQELNERLLGQVFEESLSDSVAYSDEGILPLAEKLQERKRHGIYYTSKILSDYLVQSALGSILNDDQGSENVETGDAIRNHLIRRIDILSQIQVIDFSCGSGAFLVSAYDTLHREYLRAYNSIQRIEGVSTPVLVQGMERASQAAILRRGLHGIDLLPQAVEIAKLSLWLKSAHKGEKISNLERNIISGDSLFLSKSLDRLQASNFDLVIGNPPWGSTVSPDAHETACRELSLDSNVNWDSWELFLIAGIRSLKPGGQLALVLPATLFSPEKARSRKILMSEMQIERLHNLGPDWFGPEVRMSTIVLQAKKARKEQSFFSSFILSGQLRKDAIIGNVPLRQIESQFAMKIPQDRCELHPNSDIELFRTKEDDILIARMESKSVQFGELCEGTRGEEISKRGLLWRCPSCLKASTPGSKLKGGHYANKVCPHCGHILRELEVREETLVLDLPPSGEDWVPFIDGDDINSRYRLVEPKKYLRLLSEWKYKSGGLYNSPKLLIREAGIGLTATLDESGAYVPRSLFVYRVRPEFIKEGYSNEYVLAVLLSRTMAYYIFKRFGELDPDTAMAKLTHEELSKFPIPKIDFKNRNERKLHSSIVSAVREIRSQSPPRLGGNEDLSIELALRQLWGIEADEGAYINSQFRRLEGQVIRDLFPKGVI